MTKTQELIRKFQYIYNTRYVEICQVDKGGPVNRISEAETRKMLRAELALKHPRARCAALKARVDMLLDDCEETEWRAGQWNG